MHGLDPFSLVAAIDITTGWGEKLLSGKSKVKSANLKIRHYNCGANAMEERK